MERTRLVLSWIAVVGLASAPSFTAGDPSCVKIAPWLEQRLAEGERTEFLVLLDSHGRPASDIHLSPADLYRRLTESARTGHASILADLEARGGEGRSFYIVDAVLVAGDAALARALAARPDVKRIVGNPVVRGPFGIFGGSDPITPDADQWNIVMVRAPEVWSTFGTRGEGVVVASADTGVDWYHSGFRDHYRGYDPATGDRDHSYSWHDAYDTSAIPWDDESHGTHTLGTMVANNGIGVAPGATWIACRNMSGGWGTPASYIDCMEWSLAPYPQGGDPMTQGRPDLAPNIVNNSWGCIPAEGCDPYTFDEPLARLRQAGIFMAASAGNTGPDCSTIDAPPAVSAEVTTAGAINNARQITSFSSRGPVTVDGSGRPKPDVVAPGQSIYSTLPDERYGTKNGTSMAAAHVSGVVALLWSHDAALRGKIALTRCILERSASQTVTDPNGQTCGSIPPTTFPNHLFGYGLVDAYAALALPGTDADPAPDACDCAPSDPSAYGAPVAIDDLRWADSGMLAWGDQGPDTGSGTRYDVLRGDLAQLHALAGVGGASCFATDVVEASATDSATPAAGDGFFYLVRARNACANTGWGPGRDNATCD